MEACAATLVASFVLGRLLTRALPHPEVEALLLGALYRLHTRPDSAYMIVDQAVAAAAELAGGAFKGLVNGLYCATTSGSVMPCKWRWPTTTKRRSSTRAGGWHACAALIRIAGRQSSLPATRQPPMTLRVNQRRIEVADYLARLQAAGLCARSLGGQALVLDRPMPVDALPGFADGLVSVQDAGAQRAAELLAPVAGQRVLDACAAPGGKAAHLLEAADVDLLAVDIDAVRTRRVEDNLRRLGLTAKVTPADCCATEQWWDGQFFDAILADVPCSASGVVRRHPDIKYLRRESDIRGFVRIQAEILDRLWPLLKAGGKLLYATCSVFPEENRAQIDAFVFRQPDARRLIEEELVPQPEHDGFFYALLQKAA
jgi:16S rRNA (cytosine967-C5)-methyltransferase